MSINSTESLNRHGKIPQYWGAATLANQWWCHQFFVFKARKEEETYRKAVEEMQDLGFGPGEIWDPALEEKDCIYIGGEELETMVLSDLQARLATIGFQLGWPTDPTNMQGLKGMFGPWLLFPLEFEQVRTLSEEDYLATRKSAAQNDYCVWADGSIAESVASEPMTVESLADPEVTEAMAEGIVAEAHHAEKYRRVKAYFAWKDYLVVCAPDGLGEDFAYEFKATRVAYYVRPVAKAQANLYAYFYHKPRIRVQIYDRKAEEVKTYDEPAKTDAAETLLKQAEMLLRGEKRPWPPKEWKCRTCEFVAECPIVNEGD